MGSSVSDKELELSFVFPCLNEERTLGVCINQVRNCLELSGLSYEILVADNGSTDRSIMIASELGCRVVPISMRGYGAALRGGIDAARGNYVAFADSDDTYLYGDSHALYRAAKDHDAGMAIASRMTGTIEPGAMPWLHRHLGTPVLTWLINRLFKGVLTDCNSGFRCVRRREYAQWGIRSNGMEFASELLIKALKAGTKTVEISSGLRCGPPGRAAHLRTWQDGMRHLLFILSEKPGLFEWSGLLLLALSTVAQAMAALTGPMKVWRFHVFDIHSQAILLLMSIVGAQLYVFACSLFLQTRDRPLPFTRRLIDLNEGTLFFCLLGVLAAIVLTVVSLIAIWAESGFAGLNQANHLLVVVHFLGLAAMGSVGLLSVHTLKKTRATAAPGAAK